MEKTDEQIFFEYFHDHFGKNLSEMLLRDKFKRLGISNFNTLTINQKIKSGQIIIGDVFGKFKKPDQVTNMKILYLLRFSLNNVFKKIRTMINCESKIKIQPLSSIPIEDVLIFSNEISDENKKNIYFECSNFIDGVLIISFSNQTALNFAILLMKLMAGIEQSDLVLNEEKVSAITEFFNIVLPSFVKIIGNLYQSNVLYIPISEENFKKKYCEGNVIKQPKKIFNTTFDLNIDGKIFSGDLNFIINKSKDGFNSLVKNTLGSDNLWEKSPPQKIINISGNTEKDLISLFRLLRLKDSDLDYVFKKVGKQKGELFQFKEFILFYQQLIDTFQSNVSDQRKKNIKKNLGLIFGYDDQ